MLADIQPGQQINVKITSEPKAAAHRKTLVRLCDKDETVREERKRLRKARPVIWRTRAGRPWAKRPYRVAVVKFTPDTTYKLFGSVDVLRQLASVEKYIEVTPA